MCDRPGITVSPTCAIPLSIIESCALIDVERANTAHLLRTQATPRVGIPPDSPTLLPSRCADKSRQPSLVDLALWCHRVSARAGDARREVTPRTRAQPLGCSTGTSGVIAW